MHKNQVFDPNSAVDDTRLDPLCKCRIRPPVQTLCFVVQSPDQDYRPLAQLRRPANRIDIAHRRDLSTIALARDGRAGKIAISTGSWSRTSFPGRSTLCVHLDGAQVLITHVSTWPSRRIVIGRRKRGEDLCFARAGDRA